ncbi:MAG: aspartate aminotransferase family protein, partial [Azospirillum brasilense]
MTALPPATHNLGALSQELVAKGQKYYVPNYKPREMIIDRGQGATVWDLDGNDYIDLGAGIAVNSLGHQDPDLLAALDAQSRKIWHTSNVFFTEPPIKLAELLISSCHCVKRAFFCNSGAEANEAAIKLARKYAAGKGRPPEKREIITFVGSFHGRTMATVTATAQPKYHEGFEPLPPGFRYCPKFNDEAAIEAMVNENTCAIMVEPVQGEGGVMPAKPGFLKFLKALCEKYDALLIIDE